MPLPRRTLLRPLLLSGLLGLAGPLLAACQLDQLKLPDLPQPAPRTTAAKAVPEGTPRRSDSGTAGSTTAATGDGALDKVMEVAGKTRQLGDLRMAATLYRRAAVDHPDRPEPASALGDTLLDLGEPAQAAQAYRAALGAQAGYRPAVLGLGKALISQQQPLAAAQVYQAFLASHPDDAGALAGAGVAADMAGDHAQAQALFRRGLAAAPDDGRLLNNLGYSLIQSGDYAAAVAPLERAAALPGSDKKTRQNLALAYGLAGRESDAARTLRFDWDEAAVARNLAWYRQQRQLGAKGAAARPAE
ncbi:Tetratricopeptide repeat-containing protein [Tistlia consotensis]|uniref:Tetratricopeptide repeat-containing protein n=1 Tax=Tistlia consotensis USBA 355 TaxID=560819 RepID=A0A1Y6BN84_9PROT|nr:tetratricopeptide repeat protein [Tistlia consotensis]SMF12510.1 Tetratricopeptide repeat-containing protein [Tistlia consotensis USBA 355]SNR51042.1 Tetratricopeptide repeat-containing protein [Tistlia consotensis]